jgi:hypothetical protein
MAFAGIVGASDFDVAGDHLGHALHDFYRLWESHKQPPSTKAKRLAAAQTTPDGRTASAIAWARNFPTHDLIEVVNASDLYTDYYTNLYGTLAWKQRITFTANTDKDGDRHLDYDQFLAGKPVLDTLQSGFGALMVLQP